MLIVPALDEGPLLAQAEYRIPSDVTIDGLTHDLSELSNRLLIETLPTYIRGQIKPYPQSADHPATYSRKLTKADGDIDWSLPAAAIDRQIRAYLGWPGSRTELFGVDVIITAAHVATPEETAAERTGRAKAITLSCGDRTALVIDRLKPAGKREMTGREFLAGHHR